MDPYRSPKLTNFYTASSAFLVLNLSKKKNLTWYPLCDFRSRMHLGKGDQTFVEHVNTCTMIRAHPKPSCSCDTSWVKCYFCCCCFSLPDWKFAKYYLSSLVHHCWKQSRELNKDVRNGANYNKGDIRCVKDLCWRAKLWFVSVGVEVLCMFFTSCSSFSSQLPKHAGRWIGYT